MIEDIQPWIKPNSRVLYHSVFPPRISEDTYEGRIDGEPWPIGRKRDRLVVRLYDMDARYIADFGRSVVPYTDLKFIEEKKDA